MPAYIERQQAKPKKKKNAPYFILVTSAVRPDLTPEKMAKILVDAAFDKAR